MAPIFERISLSYHTKLILVNLSLQFLTHFLCMYFYFFSIYLFLCPSLFLFSLSILLGFIHLNMGPFLSIGNIFFSVYIFLIVTFLYLFNVSCFCVHASLCIQYYCANQKVLYIESSTLQQPKIHPCIVCLEKDEYSKGRRDYRLRRNRDHPVR